MIDNRTASAIDLALQKHHTPVGDLFVAIRHVPNEALLQPRYRY